MGRLADLLSVKIGEFIVNCVSAYTSDVRTQKMISPSGDDSPPLDNAKLFEIPIEGSSKYLTIGVIEKSQGAQQGEKKLYSRDVNGTVKTTVYLKNDGTLELNGNTDFAVLFNALKTGFDLLVTNFNAHAHTETGGVTTTPITPSTASIASAKSTKVKLS